MVLIFSSPYRSARPSKWLNRWSRYADHLGRWQPLRPGGEVDHVGEQDRGRAELVGDRLRLCLEPVGDRPRQDVQQQVLRLRLLVTQRRSASSRCLANSARSVKTIVPPTAMLSASIVLVNQPGRGGEMVPSDLARDAPPEEDDEERDVPADADPHALNTSAPSGARIPQMPTPAGADEAAEQDHRQLRREQDVDRPRAGAGRSPGPGEDGDRAEQDREVHERHQTRRRPEREIERRPRAARPAGSAPR